MGLLDPATSDGRVIFFLPWQKMTIAGIIVFAFIDWYKHNSVDWYNF